MATFRLQAPRFVKSGDGKGPLMEEMTIVADLIEGELCLKANNALGACGADPTVVTHIMPAISANVLPGDTLVMPVYIVRPGDVWEMSIYHATAASAVFADTDLDGQADYGVAKPTVDSVTTWTVDKAETTTDVVRVIARVPGYSATDLYPRVHVQFLEAVCMYQG